MEKVSASIKSTYYWGYRELSADELLAVGGGDDGDGDVSDSGTGVSDSGMCPGGLDSGYSQCIGVEGLNVTDTSTGIAFGYQGINISATTTTDSINISISAPNVTGEMQSTSLSYGPGAWADVSTTFNGMNVGYYSPGPDGR